MPHAVPSPGLQALILCGPGVSLNTFTSNPKELPKALIPIANRPMVWYTIDWCHRMGISDITLIAPPESAPALTSAFKTHPELTSLQSPKPDLLFPVDLQQTSGTAQILRMAEVQKRIVSDFVVLPCDLISELDGHRVTQQWMTLNPLSGKGKIAKGGLSMFYPTYGLDGISHKKDETDFIATVPIEKPVVPPPQGSIRPEIEKLVMSMPTDTLTDKMESANGHLRIRTRLLDRHGPFRMLPRHRDAHIYILPKWVKDFAAHNTEFESISEDIVGGWAKAQWQKGLSKRIGIDDALRGKRESGAQTSDTAPAESTPVPPLLAYVQPGPHPDKPTAQPLIRRVDNSHALLAVSLYIARQPDSHQLTHANKVHPSASIGLQSRVSKEDSLIAENVKVGTRCVIKESVVGMNCEIGNNVRLTKCLLMDGVIVGDGVTLTGCIVGKRARIEGLKAGEAGEGVGENADAAKGKGKGKKDAEDDDDGKTKLVDCEVAPMFVVESGIEAKGEKMMAFEMEGMDGFSEGGDDDDEEMEIDDGDD